VRAAEITPCGALTVIAVSIRRPALMPLRDGARLHRRTKMTTATMIAIVIATARTADSLRILIEFIMMKCPLLL
jgi:hypothetical protein